MLCHVDCQCFNEEGIKIPQKVNKYSPVNMAQHPIRPDSLATLLWEPQISTCSLFVAFTEMKTVIVNVTGVLWELRNFSKAWKTEEQIRFPRKLKYHSKKWNKPETLKLESCFLHNMLLLHWNMRMKLSKNWVIRLDKSKLCKMSWRVNHWWIKKKGTFSNQNSRKKMTYFVQGVSQLGVIFIFVTLFWSFTTLRFSLYADSVTSTVAWKGLSAVKISGSEYSRISVTKKKKPSFQSCESYQVCQLCACRTFLSHEPRLSHEETFPQI